MMDPASEPPYRLVSEKYRVRGWYPAATYHKVSRFAPDRGAGCPTITAKWAVQVKKPPEVGFLRES
jgi:hypothetical protein